MALAAAMGWVAGLAWMWASKWILAAVIVGVSQVVDNVTFTIGHRLTGGGPLAGLPGIVDPSQVRGLIDNLDTWWGQPLTPWTILALSAVLAASLFSSVRGHQFDGRMVAAGAFCGVIAVARLSLGTLR